MTSVLAKCCAHHVLFYVGGICAGLRGRSDVISQLVPFDESWHSRARPAAYGLWWSVGNASGAHSFRLDVGHLAASTYCADDWHLHGCHAYSVFCGRNVWVFRDAIHRLLVLRHAAFGERSNGSDFWAPRNWHQLRHAIHRLGMAACWCRIGGKLTRYHNYQWPSYCGGYCAAALVCES